MGPARRRCGVAPACCSLGQGFLTLRIKATEARNFRCGHLACDCGYVPVVYCGMTAGLRDGLWGADGLRVGSLRVRYRGSCMFLSAAATEAINFRHWACGGLLWARSLVDTFADLVAVGRHHCRPVAVEGHHCRPGCGRGHQGRPGCGRWTPLPTRLRSGTPLPTRVRSRDTMADKGTVGGLHCYGGQ